MYVRDGNMRPVHVTTFALPEFIFLNKILPCYGTILNVPESGWSLPYES